PAERAVFALAVQSQALAIGNPRGNAHRDAPVLGRAARAATDPAGVAHDAPGARALAARPRDDQESLLEPQLAGATALSAGLGRGARRRARAVTGLAGFLARDLDGLLAAGVRLLEGNLEIEPQVRAARRALAP